MSGEAHQTLDDGEACTIACAPERNAVALLDEQKANRICWARFEGLRSGCGADLLIHDAVAASLGRDGVAETVYRTLYYGQMRVVPHHVESAKYFSGRGVLFRPRLVNLYAAQYSGVVREKCDFLRHIKTLADGAAQAFDNLPRKILLLVKRVYVFDHVTN